MCHVEVPVRVTPPPSQVETSDGGGGETGDPTRTQVLPTPSEGRGASGTTSLFPSQSFLWSPCFVGPSSVFGLPGLTPRTLVSRPPTHVSRTVLTRCSSRLSPRERTDGVSEWNGAPAFFPRVWVSGRDPLVLHRHSPPPGSSSSLLLRPLLSDPTRFSSSFDLPPLRHSDCSPTRSPVQGPPVRLVPDCVCRPSSRVTGVGHRLGTT